MHESLRSMLHLEVKVSYALKTLKTLQLNTSVQMKALLNSTQSLKAIVHRKTSKWILFSVGQQVSLQAYWRRQLTQCIAKVTSFISWLTPEWNSCRCRIFQLIPLKRYSSLPADDRKYFDLTLILVRLQLQI